MDTAMEDGRRIGLRAKVVLASVLVLALATVVSIVAVRQILLTQLEREITESLVKEVGEFRSVVRSEFEDDDDDSPASELASVFDTYLAQNIPSEGEEVLTLIGTDPYRSERAHDAGVALDSLNSDLRRWTTLDAPDQGVIESPTGDLHYVADPVRLGEGAQGTFVIANSPEFEKGEIDAVSRTMAIVGGFVLVLGFVLSWIAAGRIVAPIRELTRTARSISDTDLTRRIAAHGSDEVALLARTFNRMLDRLEEAFTIQRRFADDAGHELRTPITIVRGHLELMGDQPEDRAETLAVVMDELERMDRIVNDLLLLAKADQPDFVDRAPVDLAELTTALHAKAIGLAPREWRLEELGQGTFLLDQQRITQAMMQLATNAVQHTPVDGAIVLGSSATGGELRLWVRDSGPGVPKGLRDRIFDRFSRGDGSTHPYDGAGLGLAIVKVIAHSHGGSVELESPPGEGARFTLVIPADPVPVTKAARRHGEFHRGGAAR